MVLDRRLDAAGFQHGAHATGADVQALLDAVDDQALALDIRLERPVGASLGETDIVPEAFVLAADFPLTSLEGFPFLSFVLSNVSDWQTASRG